MSAISEQPPSLPLPDATPLARWTWKATRVGDHADPRSGTVEVPLPRNVPIAARQELPEGLWWIEVYRPSGDRVKGAARMVNVTAGARRTR